MPFEKRITRYKVDCERIELLRDGQLIEDIFMCFHSGKGFLFAKRGTPEHFEVPEPAAEAGEQPAGGSESLNSNIEEKE